MVCEYFETFLSWNLVENHIFGVCKFVLFVNWLHATVLEQGSKAQLSLWRSEVQRCKGPRRLPGILYLSVSWRKNDKYDNTFTAEPSFWGQKQRCFQVQGCKGGTGHLATQRACAQSQIVLFSCKICLDMYFCRSGLHLSCNKIEFMLTQLDLSCNKIEIMLIQLDLSCNKIEIILIQFDLSCNKIEFMLTFRFEL